MSGAAAVSLLVGTTKGAFVLDGDTDRTRWVVRGPYCDGWPINHVIGDAATGTIWAGGGGDWSGAGVWRSSDRGRSWELSKLTSGEMDEWAANDPGFAESIGWSEAPTPFGSSFSQVWSLARASGRLYAGTKPATLLVSDDRRRHVGHRQGPERPPVCLGVGSRRRGPGPAHDPRRPR